MRKLSMLLLCGQLKRMKKAFVEKKTPFFTIICLVFLLTIGAGNNHATVFYVKADGSDTINSGDSWEEAFATIRKAIDSAGGSDDEIWVKRGVYNLSSQINVSKAVAIYGGFTGGENERNQRNWNTNVTTINGLNVFGCFFITADAVINGFTIKNGAALEGGGIFIYNSYPLITNCIFSKNNAYSSGGAIFNFFSAATITNCIFSGNKADNNGGAIVNFSYPLSSPLAFPSITNCIFSGNQAIRGGGIYNFSSPAITNCTFSGNNAYNGRAIFNTYSSPVITNCILWNTVDPDDLEIWDQDLSFPTVTHSDVKGGYSGPGNINEEPFFADDMGRLSAYSPCIDAGDNDAPELTDHDKDGNPRVVDGNGDGEVIVDMGAYEFAGACGGDFDEDGDVDGSDLATFAAGGTYLPMEKMATELGRMDCPCDILRN